MSADVSRVRFDALKDYAGVELQQGRVLLDADFNELVDVLDRRLRAAAADLGSPGLTPGFSGVAVVPRTTPRGFRVTATGGKITIDPGRMYVDGIVVENHGSGALDVDPLLAEGVSAVPTPFEKQPYRPVPDQVPQGGTYLAYLDVWQREVTPLQDPALVEPALAVDTTTRVQNVWQVKLFGGGDGQGVGQDVHCDTPDGKIPGWSELTAPAAGRLTTTTVAVDESDDPCYLPPVGGYRGAENQLYRVQILTPGPLGTATFGWSRDNASVATAVTGVSATSLQVASLGKDSVLRISTGNWVEITDDHREFASRSGVLRKVTVDEGTRTLTFDPALPADLIPSGLGADTAQARHVRVVRWDQSRQVRRGDGSVFADLDAVGSTGEIPVPADGTQIVLESGVAVSFSAATAGGVLHAGDHWEFAARTADASVEILRDAPPRGIYHHFARLGFVTLPDGATDCRTLWPPRGGDCDDCADACECTVCVTAESHASGVMTLQNAVDVVQRIGGTVCVKPGVYRLTEPVLVRQATSVRIRGAGMRTVLVADTGAFLLQGCVGCAVEEMTIIEAGRAPAIGVMVTANLVMQRLVILAFAGDRAVGREADPMSATGGSGAGVGIALAGVNAMLDVRDNVIFAPIGISGGRTVGRVESPIFVASRTSLPVVAIDLQIRDNILLCQLAGIDLVSNVVHALGARIDGNEVLGCAEWGIAAIGVMLLAGSMRIERNIVVVAGHGVIVGTADARVAGNDISALPARTTRVGAVSRPVAEVPRMGIVVLPSAPIRQAGDVAVDGNTVVGFGGPAVIGFGSARTCRVDRNRIIGCTGGIVLAMIEASVSACGNTVLDLVSPKAGGLTGIGVAGAGSLLLVDNVIDGLDPDGESGTARIGIRATACTEILISRNLLRRVTLGDDRARASGIELDGSFGSATVDHNQVHPVTVAGGEPSFVASWYALHAEGSPGVILTTFAAQFPGAPAGPTTLIAVPLNKGPTFITVGGAAFLRDVRAAAGNLLVDGNSLAGTASGITVLLSTQGDVLFSGNRVEHDSTRQGAGLPVLLRAFTVIAQGNRILGGRPSSLRIEASSSFTAVGNITSAQIDVDGGLPPAFGAVNVLG